MNATTTRFITLWVAAAGVVAGFAIYASLTRIDLGRPEFLTGYVLFGLMLLLAAYNARKKLSMIPAGRSAYWLAGPIVGGGTSMPEARGGASSPNAAPRAAAGRRWVGTSGDQPISS